jgi:hypothetical protein
LSQGTMNPRFWATSCIQEQETDGRTTDSCSNTLLWAVSCLWATD